MQNTTALSLLQTNLQMELIFCTKSYHQISAHKVASSQKKVLPDFCTQGSCMSTRILAMHEYVTYKQHFSQENVFV